MGTQNTFSMNKILTAAVIILICSTAQSLDNPRYSVKRVQRLAKIPAVKFHDDLISSNRLNSTRPSVHVKNLEDAKPSEVEKSSTSNSVNINNKTNTAIHLPKTNSNKLNLRIGVLSKGKPGLRSSTASSTLSTETTQELTTVLPTVRTENKKGNITENKHTPLTTTVKTEGKVKSSNRHIDEKKVNLKRLVADSLQIVVRNLNPQVKSTIQPSDITENVVNDTTNRSQDSIPLYETTTILSPTTELKRNSIVNHINERVKTLRVTSPIGFEKRTNPGIIPKHNVTKINTFTSSQPPITTEKISDTRIKGSSPSTVIKETSNRHTRHSHSEFPKVTTVNHHITRSPGSFPRVTPALEETLRTVTETTVASQTSKGSSQKRYGERNRERVTSVPQEISSPFHDLAISESGSKKTYKTAPTERTTREFKHRPAKFTSHGPAKFKLRDSERESFEIKVETTTMNADRTQQTTEVADFTDHTISTEIEIPTTIQSVLNGADEMYKNTRNTSTSTTSITTDSITTHKAKLTRGTTEAQETSKSTLETTDHTETPMSTRGITENSEVVTYRPRGRRGRIVKIVRVTTQASVPTTRGSTVEVTTYPTNLAETNSNIQESVSETNISKSHPERTQTLIRNDITENQDFTTENLIEFTTVSTTTLNNSSSEEQNSADNKVSVNGRRRGHRVVKMVRKVPIETDTSIYSERDSNEKEKEIILTSETMNFNRPRRVKKIIKVNRKNLSDTESTTKIPATTLEDSEDYSVTLTTKNTDEISELMINPMQDKTQSTYQESDASTQLSSQDTTIANNIFETTISTIQNEVPSLKFEVVTEKYKRGRGRSRKPLSPKEILSSTTEAILETSSIKILNYDTNYDEVQDDYQINVDTDLFISSRKDKRHEHIQKRAADENSYKKSLSTSNIEDPTRNQRFISGSDSQKIPRINKLYQRHLPSEYQAAANKYRTKYLSKISRNYEQNRDRILNKTSSNKLLSGKKDDSPYPRNISELLDKSTAEKSDNIEQITLPPMTTYTDLKHSEVEPESSKRTKNSLNFKTDAIGIPSLKSRITSTKKFAITTLEKTSAAERSDEISTYKFQTKDSNPLKISLNQPPSGSIKKVISTKPNLVFPSTFQKTISPIFKSTVSLAETEKNNFSPSTKKLPLSSTESSFKSTSKFIAPSTLSANSSDVFRKHEFSTPSKKTVVISSTKSVNQESSKKHDERKTVNSEKVKQEKDKTPKLKEALTNRVNQVLAAVQQMAGAVIELPKQLLLLPVRLGFYPGIERKQREISKSVQFPCEQQQKDIEDVPKSVHSLQPGDIKVVASLGDSFTTANAALANNEDETSHNYRGVSAMGGGQGTWRQYLTLPNILREFNPKLLGYALGAAESNSPISGLNVAENGALDDQILRQAQFLVTKIRNNHFIDFKNDWKLVNIMIGSNDICKEYCFQNNDKDSPLGHLRQLEGALFYLKENLPRTFVNLIHIPNMASLQDMKNIPFTCHMKQVVQCSCLFEDSKKTTGESVSKMLQGYWEAEKRVAEDERFDSEDFTVVLQPFFLGVKSPDTVNTLLGDVADLSFFAPDCFHFSQKGYAQVANALWNNMMEPVGNKTLGWVSPLKRFMCPSEMAPYLFTKRNSQTFLQTGHQ